LTISREKSSSAHPFCGGALYATFEALDSEEQMQAGQLRLVHGQQLFSINAVLEHGIQRRLIPRFERERGRERERERERECVCVCVRV
jgi:hypothetical protein